MGFVPGAELQIISSTETGSAIVVLQNKSLGLGADMAQGILVTKIS
jgi:ferrous iron transport protein A